MCASEDIPAAIELLLFACFCFHLSDDESNCVKCTCIWWVAILWRNHVNSEMKEECTWRLETAVNSPPLSLSLFHLMMKCRVIRSTARSIDLTGGKLNTPIIYANYILQLSSLVQSGFPVKCKHAVIHPAPIDSVSSFPSSPNALPCLSHSLCLTFTLATFNQKPVQIQQSVNWFK